MEKERDEMLECEEKVEEKKEVIDIDLGDEEKFYIANDGNYFGIAFDKIFKNNILSVYNNFEMTAKRNFKNLASLILDTYNEIFLVDGELNQKLELVLFNILKVRSEIMTCGLMTDKRFFECMDLVIHCGNDLLLNTIKEFVDVNYALQLDEKTKETKAKDRKVNNELMFSDDHAKDLLKISYLSRIMIPIISSYFFYNKGNYTTVTKISEEDIIPTEEGYDMNDELAEIGFDEINSKIFKYIFETLVDNPDALRNKLYKMTKAGVCSTSLSDKKFWKIIKNFSMTEKTETLEIYKKILTNSIPKLSIDKDKNVISFLKSVINNQTLFIFQSRFKYKIVAAVNEGDQSFVTEDDNEMSEFERMEIQQECKDEGAFLIRKLNIKDVLEHLPADLNVGVSDIEVKEMTQKVTRNPIQEQIISFLTFRYFKDKDAMKYISFYEYCYLLVLCKKYLESQKYIYLPQILVAKCEKHRERLNVSGKKIRPEILNSKKYNELVSGKYNNFTEEIEKPLLAFIGTVYSSIFKNENDEEIFDSSIKVGKIAEEIVNVAKII